MWKKGSALVPVLDRVRRGRAAGAALRPAGRLRLHRRAGGRARRHRRRSRSSAPRGCPGSTSAATIGPEGSVGRSGGLKKLVGSGVEDDRRPRGQLDPAVQRRPRAARSSSGSAATGRTWSARSTAGRRADAQRANLPDDLPPDELTLEIAEKLFATPQEGRSLGTDPVTGNEIVAKEGRFGPYVTEVLPEPENGARPRRPSRAPARCSSRCRWTRSRWTTR